MVHQITRNVHKYAEIIQNKPILKFNKIQLKQIND